MSCRYIHINKTRPSWLTALQRRCLSINNSCPVGGAYLLTHDELLTRAAMSSRPGAMTFWMVTDRQQGQETDWQKDPDMLECKWGIYRGYAASFLKYPLLWKSHQMAKCTFTTADLHLFHRCWARSQLGWNRMQFLHTLTLILAFFVQAKPATT